jgi:alkaline phosphatase
LRDGALLLAGATFGGARASLAWAAEEGEAKPQLRVGLLTDVHYGDLPPRGTRYYRQSLDKVREAVARFNEERAELAFELGDLIDAAKDAKAEIGHLRAIEAEYARFRGKRNYVLGNHCVYTLTKEQFLANSGMKAPHYSFDQGGFHFVVLDACFRADGVPYGGRNAHWTDTDIPAAQLDWLRADLAETSLPTLAFVHQRLDLDKETPAGKHYAIKSSAEARRILVDSEQVVAVFMGHSHKNFYQQRDGIHYCVLRACIEGSGADHNGYALADLFADGSLRLRGFREQTSRDWPRV